MNISWQLQEAKNRFSEVVDQALARGPQIGTRHGREMVVILSVEDCHRMKQPKDNLPEALRAPAEYAAGLDITRDRDSSRNVEL